jgi:hypothetical protein
MGIVVMGKKCLPGAGSFRYFFPVLRPADFLLTVVDCDSVKSGLQSQSLKFSYGKRFESIELVDEPG